jgi:CubicO group peptidase (beta-lactamase class C family)
MRKRIAVATAVAVLMLVAAASAMPAPSRRGTSAPATEFATVSELMNDAIVAEKLPGGVVVIGHGGRIAFERAYGSRKLAGEPGLDGVPGPAEPMTTDTIFDIASLTKPLATATAVLQLYQQGKVGLDDPVQMYLPDFNPANDPLRAQVTVRMLLTHTSGEPIDVALHDPWGLAVADQAEGVRRALTMPLQSAPAEVFRYADINYILLGALIEKLTRETEDAYAQENIFAPLGMTETRYLPPPSLLPRIAPTAIDDESSADPSKNPDFGRLLRGVVHDPTARRMGGVAGHAGVFSTAHDVSLFAQALLDRLAGRPSTFPLSQATLELMTTPQQPGHNDGQVQAANDAIRAAIAQAPNATDPLLAPHYPAIEGQQLFGFGWDIDTDFSKPRGLDFPVGSFGATGFTGTSLWMDPGSDTYVILLANSIHLRGSPPISGLRGDVATAAAQALRI